MLSTRHYLWKWTPALRCPLYRPSIFHPLAQRMYTQLAEIPVPAAAQFLTPHDHHGPTIVEVSYSVRDHVRNVKRSMARSIVFSSESTPVSTPLQDVDVVSQLVSPSGQRKAVLRKSGGSRYVEIWNNGRLESSVNVTDYHGDFYADEFLGSLSFSGLETSIIYTAEGKATESKDPFEKFRFNPDFGEGLVGKRKPVLFILRLDENKTEVFQLKTSNELRFGQAVFSPNSDKIIYATGYESTVDGRLLGIKYCFNRPSGIWQLSLSSEPVNEDKDTNKTPAEIDIKLKKLTPPNISCRSPRVLTDDKHSSLVWLGCASGGAHLATSSLYSFDITSDSSKALDIPSDHVPVVGIVDKPGPDGFPGLYPAYSFSVMSGSSIILHSNWGSRTTVLHISLVNGAVKDLTPNSDNNLYSWSLLATDGHSRVICNRSSFSEPYEIMLGQFDTTGSISWRSLEKPDLPKSIKSALESITTTVVPIPGRPLVETIVIQGKKKTDGDVPPCINFPHGGPHGGSTTAFTPATVALVLEGYTISFPNYTGSPGYGEDFLQGLIGRCGELDVQDCMASARHLISIGISKEGPGMQLLTGGSHGGFLTAHLIGQFPNFFSSAILRNPVISPGGIASSDIPDWYFSEFGLPYPISSSPLAAEENTPSTLNQSIPPLVSPETFKKIHAVSPIAHVDSVCVPVLLLIGAVDRRVSPRQGIEYYHALKARYATGKKDPRRKVELLVFEGESHPLDGVEASKAGFEATKRWFAESVKGSST